MIFSATFACKLIVNGGSAVVIICACGITNGMSLVFSKVFSKAFGNRLVDRLG